MYLGELGNVIDVEYIIISLRLSSMIVIYISGWLYFIILECVGLMFEIVLCRFFYVLLMVVLMKLLCLIWVLFIGGFFGLLLMWLWFCGIFGCGVCSCGIC